MNHTKSPQSEHKKKSRFTALQLLAFVILPLFVFALILKIQERQKSEIFINKKTLPYSYQKQDYMIQTSSQPVIYNSDKFESSDSAK